MANYRYISSSLVKVVLVVFIIYLFLADLKFLTRFTSVKIFTIWNRYLKGSIQYNVVALTDDSVLLLLWILLVLFACSTWYYFGQIADFSSFQSNPYLFTFFRQKKLYPFTGDRTRGRSNDQCFWNSTTTLLATLSYDLSQIRTLAFIDGTVSESNNSFIALFSGWHYTQCRSWSRWHLEQESLLKV